MPVGYARILERRQSVTTYCQLATVFPTLVFLSLLNTKTGLHGCRSSTSLSYKGKTLELSPRNLARYVVIFPATMLKSRIFLERMSWMISLKPLPNSSEEP